MVSFVNKNKNIFQNEQLYDVYEFSDVFYSLEVVLSSCFRHLYFFYHKW